MFKFFFQLLETRSDRVFDGTFTTVQEIKFKSIQTKEKTRFCCDELKVLAVILEQKYRDIVSKLTLIMLI